MPKLFISYRRKSWPFTDRLADDLRRVLDADIFLDYTSIDETDFESSILRNLRESDAVLLIVTEYTFARDRIFQDDDWVRREIREALALDKPIVLARVDDLLPPEDLPEDIQAIVRKQGIPFYAGFFQAGVESLATFIVRVTPVRAKAATIGEQQPAKLTPTTERRTLGEAETLRNLGHYDEALVLLQELQDADYKSPYVDLTPIIRDTQKLRDAALRRKKAEHDYREIATAARMAKGKTMEPSLQASWTLFCQDYPDLAVELDTEKLFKRFIVNKPWSTLPMLEWITISAGNVTLEGDAGTFRVEAFVISKYPVTNAQFRTFIEGGGYNDDRWWRRLALRPPQPGQPSWNDDNHPRERVSWYEAMAFCRWLSHRLGQPISLPSEMQWQRAAQGDDERKYPWGKDFDVTKCNTIESGIRQTTPVDHYSEGASPFGVLDMSGNVGEWCLNEHADPSYMDAGGNAQRALRGGSWRRNHDRARATCRSYENPNERDFAHGFRLVGFVPSNSSDH